MAEITIPGGKDKGKPITQATKATLEWWSENAREEPLRDACLAELRRRKDGGAPATGSPAPSQQKAPTNGNGQAPAGFDGLVFKSDDPSSLTAWFHENRERFHIITPATMVQSLPEGCEVSISLVYVNPELTGNEKANGHVYLIEGGKLGLSATMLSKISAAAGISWDAANCGQVDNGAHPHFCKWQVVGGYRLFDGTTIVEPATKTLDLRDGSARIEDKSDKWLRAQRENIYENAETKAKNRFIRRLGIQSGYTREELQKPFAVARLMFTGRTKDPALRHAFALLNAEKMTGGVGALFGHQADRSVPRALPMVRAHALGGRKPPELLPAADDDDDSRPAARIPAPPAPAAAAPSDGDGDGDYGPPDDYDDDPGNGDEIPY